MKKAVIALGLVVVVLLGMTYVYAVGPGFGPGRGPRNWTGGWRAANMTAEQQAKLKDLRQKLRDDMAPVRDRMISLRQEIGTLWSDRKADPKDITIKTEEMKSLRDQMQDKMVEFALEVRNILTPDQLQAIGPNCGMGFGPGGGPGPMHGRGYGRGPSN